MEVEAMAKAQEVGLASAKKKGCSRFEPIQKLVERMGCSLSDSQGGGGAASAAGKRSSGSSGGARGEGALLLEGLREASAVKGLQCSVCNQYCFLEVFVCDVCSKGKPFPPGHERMGCGLHLEELCNCPVSDYTCYRRLEAQELMAAAQRLASAEDNYRAWEIEARSVFSPNPCGDVEEGSSLLQGGGAGVRDRPGKKNRGEEKGYRGGDEPQGAITTHGKANGDKGKENAERTDQVEDKEEAGARAVTGVGLGKRSRDCEGTESALEPRLLPRGWHSRPTLKVVEQLITRGRALGAGADTLSRLEGAVDACREWLRAASGLLRLEPSMREPIVNLSTTEANGAIHGAGTGADTGVGKE
ncbi:unnamed protein product, partial [Discosporangium mesarthrocarpum]